MGARTRSVAHRRFRLGTATLALVVLALSVPPLTSAATTEFPVGWEGYHTYDEVDAALDAAVAAYGQGSGAIVKRSVIGQSYEGRNIWVVKISDNVQSDEREPEVLSECGMHAREILTVEMCLYMIELLTDNYGKDTPLGERVTDIVNSREIWIVPTLNPDGAEFNISGGTIRNWRKNRQATPGSDAVGIDLNRNWSYMWNCCGGSSAKPGAGTYQGRYPFEAAENVVMRDFILSRRVGGQQQITIVFNWHAYGRTIMWPYGYTKEDIPPTMTVDDHAALVAIGRGMATRNGYKAKQGSDLYIYDGDFPAWAYGDQRMFVFTFEMYPPYGCNGCGGFRPPDDVIQRETTRNTDAVLYFIEQADCPYRAAGLGARNCGPLYDDFETGRGWRLDPNSTDTATDGAWERGDPSKSRDAQGAKQKGGTPSGLAALVTGAARDAGVSANDLDGGVTSALSPAIDLGGGSWTLSFSFTFAHDAAATAEDYLRISVIDGGTVTPIWTAYGQAANRNARWRARTLALDAWAGDSIRLLLEARDGGADNVVEAALDDMRVYRTP